jgi:hypothetical protein
MSAMFHVFNASLKEREQYKDVLYLWNPKLNIYYVRQRNDASWFAKDNGVCRCNSVERTWRAKGKDVSDKKM